MTTKQSTIEPINNHQYYFTYIIGYKHSPDRLNNLKKVLDWINGFNGVDVILIEQDKHSKISHLNLKCRHIFLKSKMSYNKSWSFNVGTKLAKTDVICFGDADVIMDPLKLIESIKMLEKFEMVNPYETVSYLEAPQTNFPIEEILKVTNEGIKNSLCSGICIFRKNSIQRIGGWEESFLGWGAEDDFMSIKVQNFISYKEMPNKAYHLFHYREPAETNQYNKNLQLLNQLKALSKEDLVKTINMSVQKIGMSNLYDNY